MCAGGRLGTGIRGGALRGRVTRGGCEGGVGGEGGLPEGDLSEHQRGKYENENQHASADPVQWRLRTSLSEHEPYADDGNQADAFAGKLPHHVSSACNMLPARSDSHDRIA